jgi:hypothetical protein
VEDSDGWIKRWRTGDQIERWVGSGLLVAECQFRKVIGYHQIPLCYARRPMLFPRSRLRKEPASRRLLESRIVTFIGVPGSLVAGEPRHYSARSEGYETGWYNNDIVGQ